MTKLNLTFSLFIILLFSSQLHSTTVVIQVGGFVFTPQNVTVTVGDTILWQWASGFHTTTSVTVPAGAQTWDTLMDAGHTTFRYRMAAAGLYNYQCTNHFLMGMTGTITANPIGIIKLSNEVPETFTIGQNYPNPFNPRTAISFQLPVNSFVTLKVYDILGREVSVLVNEQLKPGTYEVEWDATDFSSGDYFYRITAGSFTQTNKMILMK